MAYNCVCINYSAPMLGCTGRIMRYPKLWCPNAGVHRQKYEGAPTIVPHC